MRLVQWKRAALVAFAASSLLFVSACTPAYGESDWLEFPGSTAPVEPESPQSDELEETKPQLADVEQIIGAMTIEQKAAAMLMLHLPGNDPVSIATWANQIQPAGLILMGDNTEGDEDNLIQLTEAAQESVQIPLLISVDQEGGLVSRLPGDPAPSPSDMRFMEPDQVQAAFAARGTYLGMLGINTNFGIVADYTDDLDSFIYPRVLGTDPSQAATNVAAAVKGEQSTGVASTIKHFPGHGAPAGDSHAMIPVSDISLDEWLANDALPFEAGVGAGTELVMFGHLVFSAVSEEPATLSREWHDILRENLGFEGVIVTDDMRMLIDAGAQEYSDPVANVISAIAAGNDLILYLLADTDDPASEAQALIKGIVGAIESGQIDEAQIDQSLGRTLQLRIRTQ